MTGDFAEAAAHYQAQAAAAQAPRLLGLLAEARCALGPEYFELAGRIDDFLIGPMPTAAAGLEWPACRRESRHFCERHGRDHKTCWPD